MLPAGGIVKPTVYSFPSMSMLLFLSVLLALFVASLSVRPRFAPLTPDKTQPLRGIWLSGMAYEIYLCQGTAFFLTRKFLPERSGAALFIVVAFIVTFAMAWGVSRAARMATTVLKKK